MRLTLRTLLAYLDEILEPADAQEIGKKIEQSDFAGNLLHRIRDCMRRLRLKAPDIDEQDTALDPNTVSEYLDNTLADDRVPDFEKICLESDMHLAEVASCHQILAMVLGEPAEIDPASREHMYTLPQVAAEQSEMQAAVVADDDQATTPGKSRRQRPEIPAYLREPPGQKRRIFMAFVLAAAGCLAAVLLASTGWLKPLGIHSPFAQRQPAAVPRLAADADAGGSEEPEQGRGATAAPDGLDESGRSPEVAAPAESGASHTGEPPADADKTAAAEHRPTVDLGIARPVEPPRRPLAEPSERLGQPEVFAPPAFDAEQPNVLAEEETPQDAAEPATGPAGEKAGNGQPETIEPAAELVVESQDHAPPAHAQPQRIGRFISDKDVMLRLLPDASQWVRVSTQDLITTQHELLSLPTFRPLIAMTAGLTLRLIDGTRIVFKSPETSGAAVLQIIYGRVIVQTVGKPQASLALQLGGGESVENSGLLTFGDAATTLTIEVARELPAGRDPADQSATLEAELCVVTGQLRWAKKGAEPIEIEAGQKLSLSGAEPAQPTPMGSSPDWIVADSLGILDSRASSTLEAELDGQRPLSLSLKELADHRKKEIRRLAIRCLGHIGIFDQMAAVLNDPGQRLTRVDYISDLRDALARGPRTAEQVRQAFLRQYGEDAAALYRLLWGFTDEQLAAADERLGSGNVDEMLVDYLDNTLLAYRVLSFWNLQTITGLGLYYQPEETAVKRQQPVRNWRQRLKSGDIRHRKPAAAEESK